MRKNEIVALIGFLIWASSIPLLWWHHNVLLHFIQFTVGALIQTIFLSYWGLNKFK